MGISYALGQVAETVTTLKHLCPRVKPTKAPGFPFWTQGPTVSSPGTGCRDGMEELEGLGWREVQVNLRPTASSNLTPNLLKEMLAKLLNYKTMVGLGYTLSFKKNYPKLVHKAKISPHTLSNSH